MTRIFAGIGLLFFFVCTGRTQSRMGLWAGVGEYLPGDAFTYTMKQLGAEKKLVFEIGANGKISGKLTTEYGSKSLVKQENGDQQFTITGKYDEATQRMLLVVTHFRSRPDSSESYLTFAKPDSVYYDLFTRQMAGSVVITGTASKDHNKNATAEWVGAFKGGGLSMYPTGNNSMHILPLRIRFDIPESHRPVHSVANAAYKDSVIAEPSQPLALVAPRKPVTRLAKIQHTITLDTTVVKLQVYDNGVVDGDIATLIFDGKIVLNKQLLSAKPAEITLDIADTPGEHMLELFANNLGSIPPNTALVVLTCKGKRHEINLSSNETTNGAVKLLFRR